MMINILALCYYNKDNIWYPYFIHHFDTRAIYPFSTNIELLNQVSDFVGWFLESKGDIKNIRDGLFQDFNQVTEILFLGMTILQKNYVSMERKIPKKNIY